MTRQFVVLSEVAEILGISASQTYALVRGGELRAIKVGGRGQWRVEAAQLDELVQRMYDQTATFVAEHPYGGADMAADEAADEPSGQADGAPDEGSHGRESLPVAHGR